MYWWNVLHPTFWYFSDQLSERVNTLDELREKRDSKSFLPPVLRHHHLCPHFNTDATPCRKGRFLQFSESVSDPNSRYRRRGTLTISNLQTFIFYSFDHFHRSISLRVLPLALPNTGPRDLVVSIVIFCPQKKLAAFRPRSLSTCSCACVSR